MKRARTRRTNRGIASVWVPKEIKREKMTVRRRERGKLGDSFLAG